MRVTLSYKNSKNKGIDQTPERGASYRKSLPVRMDRKAFLFCESREMLYSLSVYLSVLGNVFTKNVKFQINAIT